ncbi:class I SAM-dependent methyltransferase [Streptomyces beijiangensis]|uniref:Class I SAM-dependent methyltransferase n=1 Tax=Streptomyces beijiangensis TaxID=163361 RepID=A0A939FC50_9ACTN|nr:class I SAM-dependent methyltransferase [Streptomyces beijiangensis]MBO0515501.1 class I SAM-dependent methyltransferase [Streptomyces beijiangensis]
MHRHEFLQGLHSVLKPHTYLEIGINDGRSLALSRAASVGVDPAPKIRVPLHCDLQLVTRTSDDFFAQKQPLGHLMSGRNPLRNARRGRPLFGAYTGANQVDLAFIDGMHIFEYALRDFINAERHSGWSSVLVFDDMLPRNNAEAVRDRVDQRGPWTGDVYKVIPVLAQHRPDLIAVQIDTQPTGLLMVIGADPASTVLKDRYDAIMEEWITPDPQKVPEALLERIQAVDPSSLLGAGFWSALSRRRGRRSTLNAVRRELTSLRGF